ncbi:hypothetical protein [Weissella cibaria]|uniref:hypothetical protein n=1 Tax=Weissella cibaria TaxID=137591 RepID=UPI001F22AA71|nr:hypothetical protein [Weissella cibaria]
MKNSQKIKSSPVLVKTLTTARANPDTKIAPTRLDRGIEQVKSLINRIIELTRDLLKDQVYNVKTAYLPV